MNTLHGNSASDPALLIFDCDGVLVDSEMLVCTAVSEELTRLGYAITPEDVIGRYAGRPEWEILAEVKRDWGRPVPESYFTAMKARVTQAFSTELQAIAGAAAMLAELRLPRIVASSSAPAKLEQGLRYVGLYDFFVPEHGLARDSSQGSSQDSSQGLAHVVSAQVVAQGKPSPDVFIYAAGWMRTPVRQCLVIEDSEPGVRAARAAGMRVFGFTGGSHCTDGHGERLLAAGAERVLGHMRELPQAVPSAFGVSVLQER